MLKASRLAAGGAADRTVVAARCITDMACESVIKTQINVTRTAFAMTMSADNLAACRADTGQTFQTNLLGTHRTLHGATGTNRVLGRTDNYL